MSKTQEELNEIKKDYESLSAKLKELTEDELVQITGGRHNIRTPLTANGEVVQFGRSKEDEIFIPPATE